MEKLEWNIYHGNIETIVLTKQYDFVICDPPYPKEFLPLYEVLAKRANEEWLKDDGLVVAMCGQSYFLEIVNLMSKHLQYYWISAYLTPGQPTPLRQRQVNSSWKPLLVYSKSEKYLGKTFGDVCTSTRSDKTAHMWGQSVSGMFDIIRQFCRPGQTILDPFCGAGTTGEAALSFGCPFDGIDNDLECVEKSRNRLNGKAYYKNPYNEFLREDL